MNGGALQSTWNGTDKRSAIHQRRNRQRDRLFRNGVDIRITSIINLLLTADIVQIDDFHCGLAAFQLGEDGPWGFLNENWEIAIEPEYGGPVRFSNDGYAVVDQEAKDGGTKEPIRY